MVDDIELKLTEGVIPAIVVNVLYVLLRFGVKRTVAELASGLG